MWSEAVLLLCGCAAFLLPCAALPAVIKMSLLVSAGSTCSCNLCTHVFACGDLRLLLGLCSRCLKEVALVLQASLGMAVLIEGLLFAFHLQVGFSVGVRCHGRQSRLPSCVRRASQYAADCTSQLLHDIGGSTEHFTTDLATPKEVAAQAACMRKASKVSGLCGLPACCRRIGHVCSHSFCHPHIGLCVSFAACCSAEPVTLACI